MKDPLPDFIRDVGQNIKAIRLEKNMTMEELGNRIGKTKQYVYLLEKGVHPPGIDTLWVLAGALEVQLAELLRSKNAPNAKNLKVHLKKFA